jgi:hypothetical protein
MAKKKVKQASVEHLEWLVRCRSQNQHTSLVLYKLLTENAERIRADNKLANAGIALVAVSFNLWRAVFLADEVEDGGDDLDHAIAFLKTLISDNAIAYAQDKNSRAWTFGSYLNNARYRLEGVSKRGGGILPNFSRPVVHSAKELWEILQTNTDLAVGNFANALRQPPQSN